MRDFIIDLNRYYHNHKTAIWFLIIIVIIVLLVFNEMSNIIKKSENSSNFITTVSGNSINSNTRTSNDVINEIINNNEIETENIINENNKKIEHSISSEKELIEAFIALSNSGKFDYAYNLLSNDCKELLYPTKEEFINSYYNAFFKSNKRTNIVNFTNKTYKVDYINDEISVGNNDNSVITDYITIDQATNKLNISSFIGREKIDKYNSNEYVKLNIVEKVIYLNYEIYTIDMKNLTKANIYVNNIDSSDLFIKDSVGNKYDIANEEYLENDYYISPEGSKQVQLKFYRKYNIYNDIESMNFKNIKIENRLYYEKNDPESFDNDEVIYKQKVTNYPTKAELVVKLM